MFRKIKYYAVEVRLWFERHDKTSRFVKTFIAGLVAGFTVSGGRLDKAGMTGAVAGGVTAVWNYWLSL